MDNLSTMNELNARIKALLHEIEFVHLKKVWVERMIAAGIDEGDASQMVAELGHIVDHYQSSLQYLVEAIYEKNPRRAVAQRIEDWAAYELDMGVFKIQDSMEYLLPIVKPYVPPEPEDEDDDSPA